MSPMSRACTLGSSRSERIAARLRSVEHLIGSHRSSGRGTARLSSSRARKAALLVALVLTLVALPAPTASALESTSQMGSCDLAGMAFAGASGEAGTAHLCVRSLGETRYELTLRVCDQKGDSWGVIGHAIVKLAGESEKVLSIKDPSSDSPCKYAESGTIRRVGAWFVKACKARGDERKGCDVGSVTY
jgi:hypothetical protein